jgi:uncharacterized protein DUF6876
MRRLYSSRLTFAGPFESLRKDASMKSSLTKQDLAQFTGTERLYRHGISREVCFTDGAKCVSDRAEAHWLSDEKALIQHFDKKRLRGSFPGLEAHFDRGSLRSTHMRGRQQQRGLYKGNLPDRLSGRGYHALVHSQHDPAAQ